MSVITNTAKKTLGDYTLEELATFTPEQLGAVSFDQQFSPITNTARVATGETWDSWDNTWASETRTWDELASLIDNTDHKNLGDYTVQELGSFTFEQIGAVAFNRQFSPITNTDKPA